MRIFFRKNSIPIFISILIILLAIIIKPNGQEPGDQGVKQVQAMDLVANHYQTIECKYYANALDPNYKYIPLNDTFFIHFIHNKCYYVFPFYFSFVIAPIYDFLFEEAEYLIPLLSSLITIWLFWFWSFELNLSERLRKIFLINVGLGSGIFLYSFVLSEISLNFLLVNVSLYFFWKYNNYRKLHFLMYSTILLGLTIFFRQESLPIFFLATFAMFFTKNLEIKKIFFVLPIYFVFLGLWLTNNYQIFQHPLGLRAIQQSLELGEGSFFLNRVYMYIEILFYKRDNFGLTFAFPILLIIPIYWKKIKILDHKFLPILLTALIFTFMIPLATITYQGFNWGTRFVLSMVPILLMSAFLIYQEILREFPESKLKFILIPSVSWSLLGSLVFLIVLIFSHKQMQAGNKFVSEHTENTIILLSKGLEGFTISTHGQRKVLQALDVKQFQEILDILNKNRIKKISVLYPDKDYLKGENFFTKEIQERITILETFQTKGIHIQTVILK